MNRREFIQGSGGAMFMLALPSLLLELIKSKNTNATKKASNQIASMLQSRFPNVLFSNVFLGDFVQHITDQNPLHLGATAISKNMVSSDKYSEVTVEQYITREFFINSNYTHHQLDPSVPLIFVDYEKRQALG